jgi:hypothetical protein
MEITERQRGHEISTCNGVWYVPEQVSGPLVSFPRMALRRHVPECPSKDYDEATIRPVFGYFGRLSGNAVWQFDEREERLRETLTMEAAE